MYYLVAFHDSKRFATASVDGTIIVWDAELGNIERQWLAHRGPVAALGVSPNNQRLVSAGGYHGESLVIWDISNGVSKVAVLASIDWEKYSETRVVACAWSPDGTLIASGCRNGTMHVWDALTFQQRDLVPNDDRPEPRSDGLTLLQSLQWSPDSRYLAWRCTGWTIREVHFDEWTVWSSLAEEPPKRLPSHPTHSTDFSVRELCFDPRSKYVVVDVGNRDSDRVGDAFGNQDSDGHLGYLQIRDVATGALVADLEHPRAVAGFSISPDGGSLLSVSGDGSMKTWDVESWRETASFKIDGRKMELARFSPSGKHVAIAAPAALANDDTRTFVLRLWRLGAASQCVAVFTEHKARINHLEFTRDGEFLASADESGIVHIHRLSSFIGH